ncbi:transposase-like protein [Pochonia chlamydosporia 170]|uniref:Transposase-like protein n=1 Tax=Pochonia chlamydosporia 170 TaxID=1380566 RepID=A0A179EYK4_METCM|nr:transposase-like protein [Pochonia chlamydosporia 170]OAQ58261.2 transposase-like protein [Pochonia chlamydosporia 170]
MELMTTLDRNKEPPSSAIRRVRNTSSRRTGCKFSILAKQSLDGRTWVLTHRPNGECARHNHPPSEDPSAHPAHRRFGERDATTVSNLAISGIAPREIRTYVHNHSESLATQRDIYNQIAATKRNLREGQSSIQALVDQLHNEGFWCRIRLDENNRLTAIFFAHPESVTNKHQMPLLDMVGVDSCQRSFCIAFALLSNEAEEDYTWALEHLRSLYSHELPSVISTDRCLASMNAAKIWFPSSTALLCLQR